MFRWVQPSYRSAKIATFAQRMTSVTTAITEQDGYGVNNFCLSYKGCGHAKNFTSTLMLSNAFDKEYYSPQGINAGGAQCQIAGKLPVVILSIWQGK